MDNSMQFSQKTKNITTVCVLSHIQIFVTPWAMAHPLSMGLFRQNTGVGCHFNLQGPFQRRDQTHVSCLLHQQANSLLMSHLGNPYHPAIPLLSSYLKTLTQKDLCTSPQVHNSIIEQPRQGNNLNVHRWMNE